MKRLKYSKQILTKIYNYYNIMTTAIGFLILFIRGAPIIALFTLQILGMLSVFKTVKCHDILFLYSKKTKYLYVSRNI